MVTVKDDGNGQLVGDTKYYVSGKGTDEYAPIDAKIATFTNTYSAASVDVTLTARKSLDVKVGTRELKKNSRSICMKPMARLLLTLH